MSSGCFFWISEASTVAGRLITHATHPRFYWTLKIPWSREDFMVRWRLGSMDGEKLGKRVTSQDIQDIQGSETLGENVASRLVNTMDFKAS